MFELVSKIIYTTGKLAGYLTPKNSIISFFEKDIDWTKNNKYISNILFHYFRGLLSHSSNDISVTKNLYKSGPVYKFVLQDYCDLRNYFLDDHKSLVDIAKVIFEKYPGAYVDIGANTGCTSLLISQLCSQVYSFEPQKTNYEKFKANLELNPNCNIKAYNFGVSEKEDTLKLLLSENDGAHTLEQKFVETLKNKYYGVEEIKLKTFDSLNISPPNFSLVKIDVEGHELLVLRGMAKSLSSVYFVYVETYKLNLSSLLEYMETNGFALAPGNVNQDFQSFENNLPSNRIINLLFYNSSLVCDVEKMFI